MTNDTIEIPALQPGRWTLPHLGIIRAVGVNAAAFLNNMLTQDVLLLQPGHARLGALCSVKGRMLATGWVLKLSSDELLWVISSDLVEATLKRLKMFVMRSNLVLTDARASLEVLGELIDAPSQQEVGAMLMDETGKSALRLPDVGGLRCLMHVVALTDVEPTVVAASEVPSQWLIAEVLAGVGRVTQKTVDAYVPQMLNYESTGGVSFKKGCYPGQEVVARSQFRGTLKRRAFVLMFASTTPSINNGDEVFDANESESAVGTVCNAVRCESGAWIAICSLQLAAVRDGLTSHGHPARLLQLPYELLDDI